MRVQINQLHETLQSDRDNLHKKPRRHLRVVGFRWTCGVEEVVWDTYRDATLMPDDPDDLLRELEVAEPSLKRLSRRWKARSRARPQDLHQPDPTLERVRDWIARRVRPDDMAEWLRSRFLPWLAGQTTRGTRAGQAFWSALEPDERERLWNMLEKFRAERRTGLRSLDEREVAQIAVFVHRGLVAARQAWRGHANKKTK